MGRACLVNGQRQTATLNCEISTVWETKPRTTNQRTSGLLIGPEQELKPCKPYDDDDDDDDEAEQLPAIWDSKSSS